jgi:hypothetical protein
MGMTVIQRRNMFNNKQQQIIGEKKIPNNNNIQI